MSLTKVDDLSEALIVETGTGVLLGEHAFQRRVVAFDRAMASSTSWPIVDCGAIDFR